MEPVDNTERGIRFGCGFVFGLLFFGFSAIWFITEGLSAYLTFVFVAATALGLAAVIFGDALWRSLSKLFSWLPWF